MALSSRGELGHISNYWRYESYDLLFAHHQWFAVRRIIHAVADAIKSVRLTHLPLTIDVAGNDSREPETV